MTKKNKFSLFLVFSLLATMFFPLLTFTQNNLSYAQSANSCVSVTAIGRNSETLDSPVAVSYNGDYAFIYSWSSTKKLSINFALATGQTAPTANADGSYNCKIKLEYLQGYLDSNFNENSNVITVENVAVRSASDDSTQKGYEKFEDYVFNIDNGVFGSNETTSLNVGGWGIYRFTLTINDTPYLSDFYFIKPDLASKMPKFTTEKVGSTGSLHDAFLCKITNQSDFTYADASRIKWFVKGKAKDGKMYALTMSDLTQFADCTNYLYESIDRTGLEFTFDDNNVAGQWEIWCTYQPYDAGSPTYSSSEKVETGSNINAMIVIGIIASVAVVATVVMVVVQVVKNKKEKVW